ncbi:YraN family protein [Jongsikchunia kroppenstedtii]|uniref:YraN family protein n=1 Tax=Jongsikchunia kroppenstedtii TaxID=1121721 RepID=UPI00035EE1D3|nr:YraN family protein [Jongsikchunia kroppenstedtii]
MRDAPLTRQQVGKAGEDVAATLLESLGYVLLQRNWRSRYGELDIIAADGDELVIVEVKTRTGLMTGNPAEAVTPIKYARMRQLAGQWLLEQERRWPIIRFDVVAVHLSGQHREPEIRHYRGIF